MKYTKKIFVIMFSFFIIAVLVSFSYAHFVKNDISENSYEKINIVTKNSDELGSKLQVLFENDGLINTANNDAFNSLIKFKVTADGNDEFSYFISFSNVYSTINSVDSSYNLYECDESDYNESNIDTIGSLCTLKKMIYYQHQIA